MKLNELTKQDLETIKERALQLAIEDYRKECEREKQMPKQMPDFIFRTIEKAMEMFCDNITKITEEIKDVSLARYVTELAVAIVNSTNDFQQMIFSKIVMKCFSEFFFPVLEEYGIN